MKHVTTKLFSLLAACAASIAQAGPLDPPVGPIAPTGKVLTELEPRIAVNATNTPPFGSAKFRITKPGSYYLAADVVGANGDNGILIEASNVTLDLNGFSVVGGPGSVFAISSNSPQTNIVITNGSVRGWGSAGVYLPTATGSRYTNLTVANCGSYGLYAGDNSRIEHCIVRNNLSAGILSSNRSVVANCTSIQNSGDGISLGNGSSAQDCLSSDNTGTGIVGSDASTVLDCTATSNDIDGIRVAWGCTVERCNAFSNTEDGIQIGSYSRVKDSFARTNGSGIRIDANSTRAKIMDNECVQNGTGIKVDGSSNLITGNSCTSSTTVNYVIASGNRVGTIAVLPTSGAINGNSGGSSGTVDAASNYSY